MADHMAPGKALGRRAADPDRLSNARRMARFLDTSGPVHPPSVDYFSRVDRWCLGQNQSYGTCGPTSVSNLALLVSTWLADTPVRFTDAEIFDLYRRSGNPRFDPRTGADDNGVDMTVMLSELVKRGIGFGTRNVRALAYAAIDPHDLDRMWAAGSLFGGLLWGQDLQQAQERQTDAHPPVWDYQRSRPWGGHATMAVGAYADKPGTRSDRTRTVSWAEAIDCTTAYITRQVAEAYLVIFPWHLGSKRFMQAVDMATLAADYQAITGRRFPAVR